MGASYQSGGVWWKTLVPLLALAGLARAEGYRDTQGRFTLTLAAGWRMTPGFGDTHGMRFTKPLEKLPPAVFVVHADPVPARGLEAFADAVEGMHRKDRSYRRTRDERLQVAGTPAMRRDYEVRAEGEPAVTVIAHFVAAGGRHFLLRFEADARVARRLEPDVVEMLASFAPAGERGPPPWLLGEWRGAGGVVLALDADGSVRLGSKRGRYRFDAGGLELRFGSTPALRFEVAPESTDRRLVLRSAKLAQPAVYEKGTPSKVGAAEPMGRWSTPTAKGPLSLDLRGDGRFSFGGQSGTWKAHGTTLELSAKTGETIRYRWTLVEGRLELSGGDLGETRSFERTPGR